MKKTKMIEGNVSDTIALCYIEEYFEEFNKNLISFLKKEMYSGEPLYKLRKISQGEKVSFARKTKKFYEENKYVIDIINQHSNIMSFIYNNYNLLNEKENIDYLKEPLYQYILKNKENLDKILETLNKLKKLGFKNFDFDEELDFTQKKYQINNELSSNYIVYSFDNIEVIPTYDEGKIEYKTNESNYKITVVFYESNLIQNSSRIELNSLIIDSNRLPEKIDKETIMSIFQKAIQKKQEENILIRNSIDLNISVEEIENMINKLNNVIDNLNINNNKEEYKQTLLEIQNQILLLKKAIELYETTSIEDKENITKKLIETEKKLLRKRKKDN